MNKLYCLIINDGILRFGLFSSTLQFALFNVYRFATVSLVVRCSVFCFYSGVTALPYYLKQGGLFIIIFLFSSY